MLFKLLKFVVRPILHFSLIAFFVTIVVHSILKMEERKIATSEESTRTTPSINATIFPLLRLCHKKIVETVFTILGTGFLDPGHHLVSICNDVPE